MWRLGVDWPDMLHVGVGLYCHERVVLAVPAGHCAASHDHHYHCCSPPFSCDSGAGTCRCGTVGIPWRRGSRSECHRRPDWVSVQGDHVGVSLPYPRANGRTHTISDSGTGSLRDAVSQPNRIVVFSVGGVIKISSRIVVSRNIYIAGQTAPGDVSRSFSSPQVNLHFCSAFFPCASR